MRRMTIAIGLVFLIAEIANITLYAGEIGHFTPGVTNIRDMVVPESGFYGVLYNYGYQTDRLNDANGNKISSVTIGRGNLSTTLGVQVDVTAYALAPTFIWVSKTEKVLGGKYGLYVTPTFSNTSVSGLLSSASGAARNASAGQFSVGDIFVQPVWLGWNRKHYDVSYGYGFYIPSGKYNLTTVTLPVVGSVQTEAADNTGLGFWTNQNQGSLYLYPWTDKRMAIQNTLTWEIHRQKRNVDFTPGQNLTWNWGISQYLPLKKDSSVLMEVGPSGYSSFQVSDDTGSDARNPGLHDYVHAAGLQLGVVSVKRGMSLNLHWLHEFSAVDRFQGSSINLNFSAKF